MLKQRVITAIILIAATLGVLFFVPPASFCILLGGIVLLAAWEWTNLMGLKKVSARILYLILVSLVLVTALFVPVTIIFLIAFIWWLLAVILVSRYPRGSDSWGLGIYLRGLMGIVVLVPCWAAVNYIRSQSDGIYALLFLFILVWGADSAAYFAGNQWGKHKLAPAVSPGKSIEGVVGAVVFAIALTLLALGVGQIPLQGWLCAMLLSVFTVLFSIIGDLFESMLKRKIGIKDSGQLLPGHGGLLDRIDSFTAAAPIFALGALLLGMYL